MADKIVFRAVPSAVLYHTGIQEADGVSLTVCGATAFILEGISSASPITLQVKITEAEAWSDLLVVDSTKTRALIQMQVPYAYARFVGLTQGNKVTAQGSPD